MGARFIDTDPEKVRWARAMYEELGVPKRLVAEFLGVTAGTFSHRIAAWGWQARQTRVALANAGLAALPEPSGAPLEAADLERVPPTSEDNNPESGQAVVERLRAALLREIAAAEGLLGRAGTSPRGERGQAARTLATLVKTLGDLQRIEDAGGRAVALADRQTGWFTDDARHLDELRRDLADRLWRVAEQRGGGRGDAGPQPAEPRSQSA